MLAAAGTEVCGLLAVCVYRAEDSLEDLLGPLEDRRFTRYQQSTWTLNMSPGEDYITKTRGQKILNDTLYLNLNLNIIFGILSFLNLFLIIFQ